MFILFIMMKFDVSFTDIGLSPIVEISEFVNSVIAPKFERETGKPFIRIQRGDVGFKVPEYVVSALVKAYSDEKLMRYPKSGGEFVFKDAVLKTLSESGIDNLNPRNILCTHGGQEGLQLVFSLFRGGRAVGFDPVWSCMLENVLPYSRFKIDLVPFEGRDLSLNFRTLEDRLSKIPERQKNPHSKKGVLYLNNPHNPTGRIFSREELSRINELCLKYKFMIVSDEAYNDVVFDGKKHVSMLEFDGEHIVSVFTLSKTFSATGHRIGYTVCRDEDLIEKITRGNYTQTAGVATATQHAFSVALGDKEKKDEWISYMLSELQRRRDAIYEKLEDILPYEVYNPQGAFYFFLNLNPSFKNIPLRERDNFISNEFYKNGVVAIPGPAFSKGKKCETRDERKFRGYVRISYSMVNTDACLEGVERIQSSFSR